MSTAPVLPSDLSSALVIAVEISRTAWVVAAHVPGLGHVKVKRRIEPRGEALLLAIEQLKRRATAAVARVIVAYEDTETVRAFFQDMRSRGLGEPLLVITDGAPGVIRAAEECFPRAARQRCLAHRMRNLAAKVPEPLWPEFKARATACYQAPSRAIARELRDGVVAECERELPSAVRCFVDDFEACIAHLRFPITHRRALRTTNLLERLFLEERRRLKIVPNAFGERAVLKLMYGAMIRAAERWRGLPLTDFERRQIDAVKAELDAEYQARIGRSAAASRPKVSSTQRP